MCPTGSPDSCNWQTIVKAFGELLKFLWFEFHFTVRSRRISPPTINVLVQNSHLALWNRCYVAGCVCVCNPTPKCNGSSLFKSRLILGKEPPTHMLKNWAAHTTATGLSQRSNVPSGQSRCFPDPLTPNTFVTVGQHFWPSLHSVHIPHGDRSTICHSRGDFISDTRTAPLSTENATAVENIA